MLEKRIRAAEISHSRELLAEVSAIWTQKFTQEDHQITRDITGKLQALTEAGVFGPNNENAKLFHVAVACLTLARGFSERERLAVATA